MSEHTELVANEKKWPCSKCGQMFRRGYATPRLLCHRCYSRCKKCRKKNL